ncbi:hypothetical protein [Flaviflagellibacter deserti]|uniref:Class I SAM-dependent methyltransferase n=1 Tax=Flaviflagellibacter deserti TaxID=2267266 RepID=A0ABV9YYP5_9HYPH
MKPELSDEEFTAFSRHYRQAKRVVEFGAGGSTYFGVTETSAKICAVESDPEWLGKMRSHAVIEAAETSGSLRLIHVDIGPIGKWGRPRDDSQRSNWPLYAQAPWPTEPDPDLIFVDGRFRLACLLTSVLKSRPGTVIMAHDFWNRPTYHGALPFLRWQESVGTLGIFRRPRFVDRWRLRRALEAATFDLE